MNFILSRLILIGLLLSVSEAVLATHVIKLQGASTTAGFPGLLSVQMQEDTAIARKPVSLKLTISKVVATDPVTFGIPNDGVALTGTHAIYYKNVSEQRLDIVISPLKSAEMLSAGELAILPLRLTSLDSINQAGTVSYRFAISSSEFSDGQANLQVIADSTSVAVSFIIPDSDGDGIPDHKDRYPTDTVRKVDTDNDGIADFDDGDDDNDGLPDAWENQYGFNSLSAGEAAQDADGDGLSNLQEYLNGTNPRNTDTDNDGMPDGWELKYNFNPKDNTDADLNPDDDNLSNLGEYQNNTDPYNPDTDGDGLLDGDEVAAGTDPNVNIPAIMSIIQQLLLN